MSPETGPSCKKPNKTNNLTVAQSLGQV